eukprot:COSAG05_NODE_311_length_11636_cov_11.922250_12_plen_47_part_00
MTQQCTVRMIYSIYVLQYPFIMKNFSYSLLDDERTAELLRFRPRSH